MTVDHIRELHPDLIEFEEICQLFGCTEASVVVLLRTGDLPGVKLGRDWRIPRQAFWQRVNEMALEKAADRRSAIAGLEQPLHGAPSPSSMSAHPRPRGRPRLPR